MVQEELYKCWISGLEGAERCGPLKHVAFRTVDYRKEKWK